MAILSKIAPNALASAQKKYAANNTSAGYTPPTPAVPSLTESVPMAPRASVAPKPVTPTATVAPAPTFNTNNPSLVDFLTTNKQASDYGSRSKLATQYGINNYVGTADQNTKLLGMLRGAGTTAPAPVAPTITPTPVVPNLGAGDGNFGTYQGETKPIVPAGAEAPAPVVPSPLDSPLFTSPAFESATKDYESKLPLTPEEIANAEAQNKLQESYKTAYLGEGERPIPLEFITGRQKSLESRKLALSEPLTAQAALLQAKRTAVLEASKFRLDTEATRLGALREASKPVPAAAGTSLINPLTGKTVATGGSLSDKQALDTFFNLAQLYPDANIQWDDKVTNQQNLINAQKASEASPSFQAKQTVYAINPLTGEPVIINKRAGLGTDNGSTPTGTNFGASTIDNLSPELKSSLSDVAGIQYFDASKITPAQLPYLQRASQQLGIPMLSKEDANLIQVDASKYEGSKALMGSILELVPKVIKAGNNPVEMTAQAARLKAIQLAPTLSSDNNAKTLLSTINSFTSLLARAAGEKGVLTDFDVNRIKQALPSISDNKDLALQKAQQLDNIFQATLQGSINTYIGKKGASSQTNSGAGTGGSGFAEQW